MAALRPFYTKNFEMDKHNLKEKKSNFYYHYTSYAECFGT